MTKVVDRRNAVLALALVASLLAWTPSPAGATDGVSDRLPVATACLGEATDSAGFEDTAGLFAEQAIDCLAYYGITQGTSPNNFTPNQPINRAQMALFLSRAAQLAGVSVPEPVDQGFTDLENTASFIRDAINQLAGLGITRGTSATTFTPNGLVDRSQMALFLYRFLLQSSTGPGGVSAAGVTPDDTVFTDIGHLSDITRTAIRVLYEMGITTGSSASTFSPRATVTRGQMALFITRTLAHTNARPAGITIQSAATTVSAGDTLDVYVSVRGDDRLPKAGALVDLFTTSTGDPTASFNDNGTCVKGVEVAFGALVCKIDQFDRQLDTRGNLLAVLEPTDHMAMWAWTGAVGKQFKLGTSDSDLIEITVLKSAAAVKVADDMLLTAAKAKMGEPVIVEFQLVDEDGRAVSDQGVRIQTSTTFEVNGVTQRTITKTYQTSDQGIVRLSLTGSDPDGTRSGDTVKVDLDVGAQGLETVDRTTLGVVAEDADDLKDAWLEWSDTAPAPATLRLIQTVAYHEVAESGPGPVHLVRAVLTDQYGDPVPDAGLEFTSSDPDGIGKVPLSRESDESGMASVRYLRAGSKAFSELISAKAVASGLAANPVYHYWVAPQPKRNSALGVPILVGDARANLIVYNILDPKLVRYDTNDRFAIDGAAVSMAVFDAALAANQYAKVSVTNYSSKPEGVSSFELTNTRIFDSAG